MGFFPAQGFVGNPVVMREIADPSGLADSGKLYVNDVAGRSELMYKDDTGAEIQFTSAGVINAPAGGGPAAPSAAQYVVLAVSAGLSAERVLTGTANQIVLADGGANGNITVSTPQNIHTGATPTFSRTTLTQATGTSPLTVSSTTVVTSLNSDLLDGRDETAFALLAGRAAGQILVGGTAASDDLTLRATSNATDGDIIFETDPTTERARILSSGEFFVGATAALSSDQWLFRKDQNGSSLFGIANKNAGASGLIGVQFHNDTSDAASIFLTSSTYPATAESGPDELVIEHGSLRIGSLTGTYRVKAGGAVRQTFLSTGEMLVGTATAFGGELATFRKDGTGANNVYLANQTDGAASQTQLLFVNDSGVSRAGVAVTATSYTPSGGIVANAIHLIGFSASASVNVMHLGTGPVLIKGNGANELARFVNDGTSKLSFFGVTAAARAAAYTQTYATAARTQNALTGVDLTDNSTGTASDTIADAGIAYVQSTENDFRASIARAVDRNTADILNIKQVINALIDDLQGYGLAQ